MSLILEDKEAIRDLLSAYRFHVDNGEFDEWADLIAGDAILEADYLATCWGRAEIKAFIVCAVGGDKPLHHECNDSGHFRQLHYSMTGETS